MAYPNIEAILEEGGDITVGRVGSSGDAGAARGESFVVLLHRLDRSIAKAWEQEITIGEVNG
jgi:hypothetical protein